MSEILVNTIKKADGTGSITVPADSGTLLTSVSSIPVANLDSAVGITVSETWKITSDLSTSAGKQVVGNGTNASWTRSTGQNTGYINEGITESSGVFTFPSTGIWNIVFLSNAYSQYDTRVIEVFIETCTDGSTFSESTRGQASINAVGGNNTTQLVYAEFNFDCTSTSTHKARFNIEATSNPLVLQGQTGSFRTGAIFTRLGDT